MRTRTIAVAGTIMALSAAATPVAAAAATSHHGSPVQSRVDRSGDVRGVRHFDRTPDRSSADRSRDRSSTDRSRDIRDR